VLYLTVTDSLSVSPLLQVPPARQNHAGGVPYTGLGEEYDSGLTFANARYYDPTVGRFISEDTYKGSLWNPQSQNLYAYVENNPLNWIDPSGNMGQKYICNSNDEACKQKAEEWRQQQIATASATLAKIGEFTDSVLDNMNAFGPAGAELEVTLRDAGYALKYGAGLADEYFAAKSIQNMITVVDSGEGVWALGPSPRGKKIDSLLGNNLGDNFPTVDKLIDGNLISIKSYDTTLKSNAGASLGQKIKKDINALDSFTEQVWKNTEITLEDYSMKSLQAAIPDVALSSEQVTAIRDAIDYAATKSIKIILTVVK